MTEVYKWTDKRLPAPKRASGFDAGNGGSDAKRQVERLKADNADLQKTVIRLEEGMRSMMLTVEALKGDKKSKKGDKPSDKPEAGEQTGN